MIEIKKLTKTFGHLVAVSNLDLQIGVGDIFGFIGPNGAGKTTTMRILVTLLEPTSGEAFIDGLDVRKKGKEVRRRVGYMPDFMGVYDDLKVFEYLEFFAAAFGIEYRKRKSHRRRRAGADRPGLQAGRPGGQPVPRHAAAPGPGPRADPRPEGADPGRAGQRPGPARRIEMRELLRELKRMGKTIMISSHILSELEEICDRIGIIEHGQLVFSGTLEEIRPRLGIQSKVRVKVLGNESRALELLSALPQIQSVELMGTQPPAAGLTPEAAGATLLVTFKEGATSDGLIARTLVTGGVDLVYLQPEQLKLDDAFLQLTKGIVH